MDGFSWQTDVRSRSRSSLLDSRSFTNLQIATLTMRRLSPPLNFITEDPETAVPSGCAQPSQSSVDEHQRPPPSSSAVGPTFLGSVYTMGDPSKKQIVALGKVRELPQAGFFPPFLGALSKTPVGAAVERGLLWWVNRGREKPHFEFFLNKEVADKHVKDVQGRWLVSPEVSQSGVVECPLQEAYNCTKIDTNAFKLVPDKEQVREAKCIIRKQLGRQAAKSFRGTPVFAAQNFNIVVPSSEGVQWYTPCFLDKSQLRAALDRSVDLHFEGLIRTRRAQRYGPLDPGTAQGGLGGNPGDNEGFDDESGLLDPSDMKDLMEEAPPGASVGVDKILFTLASVYVQDLFDDLVLGNKWGRTAVGLQPRFAITVDTFEDCAAAAEAAAIAKDRFRSELARGFKGLDRSSEIGRLQRAPPVSNLPGDAAKELEVRAEQQANVEPSESGFDADRGARQRRSGEESASGDVSGGGNDVSTSGRQWWDVIMDHPAFKQEALVGEKPTKGVVVNRGPGWAIVRRGPFWNRQYVLEQDADAKQGGTGESSSKEERSRMEGTSPGDVAESLASGSSAQAAANDERDLVHKRPGESGAQKSASKTHRGRKTPPLWSQRGSGNQPGSGRYIDEREWQAIKASIEEKLKQQGAAAGADSRQKRWESIKASIESKLAATSQEEAASEKGELLSSNEKRELLSSERPHRKAMEDTPHLKIDAWVRKRKPRRDERSPPELRKKEHPRATEPLGAAGVVRNEARMALIAVAAGSPQERDLQSALDAVSRDLAKKEVAETSVMFIANMSSLFEPVVKGPPSLSS